MSFLHNLAIRSLIRFRLARKTDGTSEERELLRRAAKNWLTCNFGEDEIALMKNFELLRRNTNDSAEVLEMNDYGAVNRKLSAVKEQGNEPVRVSRKLGKLNRMATKPAAWTRFFYSIVKELKPSLCLELGTCTGFTSMYIGAAMKETSTQLITIEGDRTLSALAHIAFEKLRLKNIKQFTGSFDTVLPKILEPATTFDFVFVDGNHREEPTVRYFDMLSPHVRSGGIMIFDDIIWSKGMRNAWQRISSSEKILFSVNLIQIGICVMK